MKKILLGIMLATTCLAFGQKVKFKGDKVIVNDKECLIYVAKSQGSKNSFSSLDGKPLFFVDIISTGFGVGNGYVKISFVDSDEVVTTDLSSSKKVVISQLIEMGIITDCSFYPERIKDYVKRYNQKY